MQRLIKVRLTLLEYAASHSLGELLTKTLDEVGALVESPLGFYHFVEEDQQTISLQQWSSRTLGEFCRTEEYGTHYPLHQAGVWADCVRKNRPVVHNDYPSMEGKRGLPEGHAKVLRELVVPILRSDRVVAILGVGNKPSDYTERDVETVSYLGDVTWEIIQHKSTAEALRKSENKFRQLFETMALGVVYQSANGEIISANPAAEQILGMTLSEMMGKTSQDSCWQTVREDGTVFLPHEHPTMVSLRTGKTAGPCVMGVFNPQKQERVWLSVTAIPLFRGGEEHPFQAYCTFQDITAQHNAERNYKNLFREMLNGFALHEIICDETGQPTDYRFLELNPAFERMTGLKAEIAVGKTVRELLPTIETHWIETYGRVALTGIPIFFENYSGDLDRHFHVAAYSPAPRHFACVFSDISELRETEKALRASEESYRINCTLLQSILESSPDIIVFALDTGCNYLAFNTRHKEAIKAIWGMEIAVGMNMLEVIGNAADRERARLNFDRALSGESFILEEWYGDAQLSRECWLNYYSPIRSDAGNITGMTCFVKNITGQKQIEGELVAREQQFRSLVENSPDIVIRYDTECRRILVSPALVRLVGEPAETLLGVTPADDFLAIETVNYLNALKQALKSGREAKLENVWRGGGGRTIISYFRIVPEFGADGRVVSVLAIGRDITELKRLEEQLNQSQKMEAVGQLAGGIAHDFNNIMTAIVGFAHIIGMKLGQESPLTPYLDKILASAERASSLTRDLLTFSRKEVLQLKPIDSREALAGAQQLISRLLREDIELTLSFPDEPLTILAGETQLIQILMNLTANARDAMPSGGKITITVSSCAMDREFVERHGYGREGEFALITFADTGCGMDEKTRERIFEPFFTTKEFGQGTGLGLATIYGIVRQLEGFINVSSEPGRGTTFRIYLPLAGGTAATEETMLPEVSPPEGTETVLVAEDESGVREIVETLLSEAGYNVMCAKDGTEALRVFTQYRDSINLLVLDAIMPGKNGIEVFRKTQEIRPQIKAILMSGYTSEIMEEENFTEKGMRFLQKPVNPRELLLTVREVLDHEELIRQSQSHADQHEGDQ